MEKRKEKYLFALKELLCTIITIITVMTSCVHGDLYDLYADDMFTEVETPRKKNTKDYNGVSQTIGGQTVEPFTNTCFIAVAAYYKNGKNTNGNFMNHYYSIFDGMIKGYYGGTLPNNYSRAYEANKWFVENGKTVSNQDFVSYLSANADRSVTYKWDYNGDYFNEQSLRDFIESHKTVNNLNNNDYIIDGDTQDGRLHFAIYSGYSVNSDGSIQINTFDPGSINNQTITHVVGVYIPGTSN